MRTMSSRTSTLCTYTLCRLLVRRSIDVFLSLEKLLRLVDLRLAVLAVLGVQQAGITVNPLLSMDSWRPTNCEDTTATSRQHRLRSVRHLDSTLPGQRWRCASEHPTEANATASAAVLRERHHGTVSDRRTAARSGGLPKCWSSLLAVTVHCAVVVCSCRCYRVLLWAELMGNIMGVNHGGQTGDKWQLVFEINVTNVHHTQSLPATKHVKWIQCWNKRSACCCRWKQSVNSHSHATLTSLTFTRYSECYHITKACAL